MDAQLEKDMHIHKPLSKYLAFLGALTTLADDGIRMDPNSIRPIREGYEVVAALAKEAMAERAKYDALLASRERVETEHYDAAGRIMLYQATLDPSAVTSGPPEILERLKRLGPHTGVEEERVLVHDIGQWLRRHRPINKAEYIDRYYICHELAGLAGHEADLFNHILEQTRAIAGHLGFRVRTPAAGAGAALAGG